MLEESFVEEYLRGKDLFTGSVKESYVDTATMERKGRRRGEMRELNRADKDGERSIQIKREIEILREKNTDSERKNP